MPNRRPRTAARRPDMNDMLSRTVWSTRRVMWHVTAALVPACIASAVVFGVEMLGHLVVALTAGSAVDNLVLRTKGERADWFRDPSTPITCLLIGLSAPASAPLWITVPAVGVALLLAKEAFGGIGRNLFNPAMAGYAVILVSYPVLLTMLRTVDVDATTGATALELLRPDGSRTLIERSASSAFGYWGAAEHEWVNGAALAGGLYLVARRIVGWHIPVAVLLGMALACVVFYDGGSSTSAGTPLQHAFSGASMLAAFFIATDPVTAPALSRDQWLFGIAIGFLIVVIRALGSFPDGVAFAVLLANVFASLRRVG